MSGEMSERSQRFERFEEGDGEPHAEVTREVVIAAPAEDVWAALSAPEHLREWLGDDVVGSLTEAGSAGAVREGDVVHHVWVDEVEPGRRVAFQWWPAGRRTAEECSEVEFVLESVPGGTRFVVTERRLSPGHPGSLRLHRAPRLQASRALALAAAG